MMMLCLGKAHSQLAIEIQLLLVLRNVVEYGLEA